MSIALACVDVADTADAWRSAGFTVGPGSVCTVGGVGFRLVGREHGLGMIGWTLSGQSDGPADVDGVPTTWSPGSAADRVTHPNGVVSIDHVVVLSPDLNRTVGSFAAIGIEPRRQRDGELGGQPIRQIFFRFGEVIVEAIGSPGSASDGPSTLWGVTYLVDDIDATAAYFGERTSPVKDAVQAGRRITTLRHREFDLSVRTALISAHVPR